MRLIDADHLHDVYMKWFKKEMLNDEKIAKTISWADALLESDPTVDAIPKSYIESEMKRVNLMISESQTEEEATRLTNTYSTLDALISNWLFGTGDDWRS